MLGTARKVFEKFLRPRILSAVHDAGGHQRLPESALLHRSGGSDEAGTGGKPSVA